MSSWGKISLFKFQQIETVNKQEDLSDIDKTLFATCIVFDKTEYQLDNIPVKKVQRMINKVTAIFSSQMKARYKKRIGCYKINYDYTKWTFGQFIELAFFLSNSPMQQAHYILASVSRKILTDYKTEGHAKRADYFLKTSVPKAVHSLNKIMQSFETITKEFKDLFGLDEEVSDSEAQVNRFNRRYGWIYSASVVAEYERITLDEAYKLPVRQALNDLVYLKAKQKYEHEQYKKA